MAESPTRYRVPALDKGLDILELLAHRSEGLSQSEIADGLGRTVGEIFRMLDCLVRRGYVSVGVDERYQLTLRLLELGRRSSPAERLIPLALPYMKRLAMALEQSCHLCVAEAGCGVLIAQVNAPTDAGFSVRVGTRIDLTSTASGHVLLAFQDEQDYARLLDDAAIPRRSPRRRPLALRCAKVRKQGLAEQKSSRIRGIHDLSAPIVDVQNSARAALTIPFVERLDVNTKAAKARARAALLESTRELSRLLGASGHGPQG